MPPCEQIIHDSRNRVVAAQTSVEKVLLPVALIGFPCFRGDELIEQIDLVACSDDAFG